MASRVSFTQLRLEAELERCRAECQWDKMPNIIDQMQAARIHEDGEWSGQHLEGFSGDVSYCFLTVFPVH